MRIGIPKEIKDNENRVGVTPAGVKLLVQSGHQVMVETNAGIGSGISDDEYRSSQAEIVENAADVWNRADMVIKVKEPLSSEYQYFREGLILFAYLHLAAEPELTKALIQGNVAAICYETVQHSDGSLPLLTPMSEIAGRMSVQIGAALLEKSNGGRGILLGGVPGVKSGEVVIIGGGVVGTNAARIAVGLGAVTTIIDSNAKRLRYLDDLFQGRVITLMSNPVNIDTSAARADLLIGAVLIPGVKAPRLVGEGTVKLMKPGSVIIDVAIDQGGSIETIDRITTHSNPTYIKHGVVHYSVANMPGAVPYTSTLALTNVTIPYALHIANHGVELIAKAPQYADLAKGFNVLNGYVVHVGVAEAAGLPFVELQLAASAI